jgi:demethylmenaquinone methyltransferase/2-methoxy-6-polyprenyl-1,4-benzoquinol methylase
VTGLSAPAEACTFAVHAMAPIRSQPPAPPRAPTARHPVAETPAEVRRMFSAIAPRYDVLNHLLSLNLDRRWRRRAVDRLGWERAPRGTYLDACAGTFDLALELARRPGFEGRVVATDFSLAMLRTGRPKLGRASRVRPACADTLALPFPDATFDGATVAFGIRNLADAAAGVRELARVLRPGARLVVLDFALPRPGPWRSVYLFYFTRILPRVGRCISQHSFAYRYLPESVLAFDAPERLADLFGIEGFERVEVRRMTGGTVALVVGERA